MRKKACFKKDGGERRELVHHAPKTLSIHVYYLACVCSRYNARSDGAIVGHYSPSMPTGRLRARKTFFAHHVLPRPMWVLLHRARPWQLGGRWFSVSTWTFFVVSYMVRTFHAALGILGPSRLSFSLHISCCGLPSGEVVLSMIDVW